MPMNTVWAETIVLGTISFFLFSQRGTWYDIEAFVQQGTRRPIAILSRERVQAALFLPSTTRVYLLCAYPRLLRTDYVDTMILCSGKEPKKSGQDHYSGVNIFGIILTRSCLVRSFFRSCGISHIDVSIYRISMYRYTWYRISIYRYVKKRVWLLPLSPSCDTCRCWTKASMSVPGIAISYRVRCFFSSCSSISFDVQHTPFGR